MEWIHSVIESIGTALEKKKILSDFPGDESCFWLCVVLEPPLLNSKPHPIHGGVLQYCILSSVLFCLFPNTE